MDSKDSSLRVNGDRLWDSLMEMAKIGATEKGGVCRLALTDLDRESRELLTQWAKAENCTLSVDAMGNMYFRRAGLKSQSPPVGAGSHLDSQPTGGKFDGVYGVLAALEVVRTFNDNKVVTELPVEIVVWTNEEGARFPPAMIGSAVCAGVFDLEYGHSRADHDGNTIGEELRRIGYLGDSDPVSHRFSAFYEAHIEQGPILEAEQKLIGVVKGVQGVNWYDIEIQGEETHAGPTPMENRKDALRSASRLLPQIYDIAARQAPHGRATVGEFRIVPGSRNTVPSRVELTVDFRHPDLATFDAMDSELKALIEQMNKTENTSITLDHIWRSQPVQFDQRCIDIVTRSANICGLNSIAMISGAGHDSVHISKVSPVSMIFIPCDDGVSHAEVENTSSEAAKAGADVLLHSVIQSAQQV